MLRDRHASRAQKRNAKARVAKWERLLTQFRKAKAIRRVSDRLWGGSRAVTNEIIDIVAGRAPITSRKRVETFGNPGSDHHVSQLTADAVDFGIGEAHDLKNEISRRLGGPNEIGDFANFTIKRRGHTFRVQPIAGTHGTGPHLHYGVRRLA